MKKWILQLSISFFLIIVTNASAQIEAKIHIKNGSGSFMLSGGLGHEHDSIKVYYRKPQNYTKQSQILIVIPGSGRNGDSYRDSWIEASEKHSILIISPAYSKEKYPFGDYHLGGVLKDLNLYECVTYKEGSNNVILDEEKFSFRINPKKSEWLFNDFDRLFEHVIIAVGSSQKKYDIFGHSAGGQILHRFVLFFPNSKANRILASNSGSYTIPDLNLDIPFGMNNINFTQENLKYSFKKKLVLFIGELDNENEKRGHLLRSLTNDKHGLHRLERAKYFYKKGDEISSKMKEEFNWKLHIVPNIGHNQRKMAKAAAKYLYENKVYGLF